MTRAFLGCEVFPLSFDIESGEEVTELQPLKTYSGGNYTDLMKFLEKQTGKSNPKVECVVRKKNEENISFNRRRFSIFLENLT